MCIVYKDYGGKVHYDLSLKSLLEKGYSLDSTIFIFGFTYKEKSIIEECIKGMAIIDIKNKRKNLKVYETDEINDIYGIPYFTAFINFKNINEKYQL